MARDEEVTPAIYKLKISIARNIRCSECTGMFIAQNVPSSECAKHNNIPRLAWLRIP